MKIRIYFEDTDAGGVVYYANYLKFMERARTTFLEKSGIKAKELYERGIFFAVKSARSNYIKPIFYGDDIFIDIFVDSVKKASFNLKYEFFRNNEKVFEGETLLVCIDKNFKILPLPKKIKEFLLKNGS